MSAWDVVGFLLVLAAVWLVSLTVDALLDWVDDGTRWRP